MANQEKIIGGGGFKKNNKLLKKLTKEDQNV